MCAINPKRSHMFTLKVYTSMMMTDEQWENAIQTAALSAEQRLNEDGSLRWHITDASKS